MKNWEKFLFLIGVVAVAFFIRAAYPSAAGSSHSDEANATQTVATPPLLILSPQNPGTGVQTTSAPVTGASAHFTRVGNAPAPVFAQEGSLVADLADGTVFSAVNASARWPTASLTKLMTATVVLDNLDPSTRITISPEVFAVDPTEPTLVQGGTYTVEDLLHVLLMPSSNVAAEALADYIGHAQFMDFMNARAAEWGMKNTHFDDPSGLSAANQSTPADMFVLAQKVYKNYPGILSITRTAETSITELNSRAQVPVKSINDFAGTPGFLGGKTGHTDEAGGNLLSIFHVKNDPIMIVVLGTDDRFGDTTKLLNWFTMNYR